VATTPLCVKSIEHSNHSDLERLADSLTLLKNIHQYLRKNIVIEIYQYDQSVQIGIKLPFNYKISVVHQAFRIYDTEKPVDQRNVADNEKYISSIGHPICHRKIKEFLQSLGYKHFHNPYSDYISQRFRECIAGKK
jgi:hypothetical protein